MYPSNAILIILYLSVVQMSTTSKGQVWGHSVSSKQSSSKHVPTPKTFVNIWSVLDEFYGENSIHTWQSIDNAFMTLICKAISWATKYNVFHLQNNWPSATNKHFQTVGFKSQVFLACTRTSDSNFFVSWTCLLAWAHRFLDKCWWVCGFRARRQQRSLDEHQIKRNKTRIENNHVY